MEGDEELQKHTSASTKLVHSKEKSGFTSHPQHACVCACLCLGKPGLPLTNESADREKVVNSVSKATVWSCAPHRGYWQRPAEGAIGAEIPFALPRTPRVSPSRGPLFLIHPRAPYSIFSAQVTS